MIILESLLRVYHSRRGLGDYIKCHFFRSHLRTQILTCLAAIVASGTCSNRTDGETRVRLELYGNF